MALAIGAAAGVVGAAGIAWLWSRYSRRINLALFFQCTAIFLFVFVVQLVIKGFHEMAEQRYLPWSDIIHARTEAWGPDSAFGHLLSYLLVVLPLAWLLLKAAFSRRPVFQREQTTNDRGSDLDRRPQVLGDNQQGVLHAR
jgi:high-affinity Fe2+/Pb2+ permease